MEECISLQLPECDVEGYSYSENTRAEVFSDKGSYYLNVYSFIEITFICFSKILIMKIFLTERVGDRGKTTVAKC